MGARWVNAALVALACAAGLIWTGVAAFHVHSIQVFDTRVFYEFAAVRRFRSVHLAIDIVNLGDPKPFAVLTVLLVGVAVALRRYSVAAAVAVVIVGANVTTQLLKTLTAAPRDPLHLSFASWPSGHTTAIAALALCAILVAPSR